MNWVKSGKSFGTSMLELSIMYLICPMVSQFSPPATVFAMCACTCIRWTLRQFRGMFKIKTRRYLNYITWNYGYMFGTFFNYIAKYIQWMQVLYWYHKWTVGTPNEFYLWTHGRTFLSMFVWFSVAHTLIDIARN